MKITITNCHQTPKWVTLQTLIRETTNEPKGRLVTIERADQHCDYRQPGSYHLQFEQSDQTRLPIELEIVAI